MEMPSNNYLVNNRLNLNLQQRKFGSYSINLFYIINQSYSFTKCYFFMCKDSNFNSLFVVINEQTRLTVTCPIK